jgi:hypothetical protein
MPYYPRTRVGSALRHFRIGLPTRANTTQRTQRIFTRTAGVIMHLSVVDVSNVGRKSRSPPSRVPLFQAHRNAVRYYTI